MTIGNLRICLVEVFGSSPEMYESLLNRPYPSSIVPLFQKCETIVMKMSSACSLIFMQIKVIFIRIVLHLDLL